MGVCMGAAPAARCVILCACLSLSTPTASLRPSHAPELLPPACVCVRVRACSMRNRDGRYSLMFEEWVTEEPFIISPRITFEVGEGVGLCWRGVLWGPGGA